MKRAWAVLFWVSLLIAGLPAGGADKVVIQNSRLEVALDPSDASFTVRSKTTGQKELRLTHYRR